MSGRGHQHHFGLLISQIFNGRKNRFRFHDHSLAAAERCIVHDVMFVRGPVPQVMDLKIDNSIFLGAFHDAFAKLRATDVGKQCQNVDLHEGKTSNAQPASANATAWQAPNVQCTICNAFSGGAIRVEMDAYKLFHDLEDRPLTMARSRTGEHRANSLNGLAASDNNPANVSSSKLQLKDRGSAAWNFRQDHVVRKFDQLANDELEELSHATERLTTNPPPHNTTARQVNTNTLELSLIRSSSE